MSDLTTAAMWPMLPQDTKDVFRADITEAGFDWRTVQAIEYRDGNLYSVTVLVQR